ncbi:MAG: NAD-dependent epimerase/dehydratase family protein [Burkholderiales bacterium]
MAEVSRTAPGSSPVLVTGASGFIGSVVCARLLRLGYHVKAMVRSRERAYALPDTIERVLVPDISGASDWTVALKGIGGVIHLVSPAARPELDANGQLEHFRSVNVEGTRRLAEQAAAAGVRRFVYMSTLKVNGERSDDGPFSEEDLPRPEDAYGISKWEAEQALRRVAAETGMEIVVLRAPIVYGPGVKGNFLRLMHLVARGVPLPLASIENRRSLIYVGNLVDATLAAIASPQAAGNTYLVSDGEDVSTPDLVRGLARALGVKPRLLSLPLAALGLGAALAGKRAEFTRLTGSLQVDSSRIRRELDWRPPDSLSRGLAETARWYHAQSSA